MKRSLVIIEKAAGNYSAYSPDLPGRAATSKTKGQTATNRPRVIGHIGSTAVPDLPARAIVDILTGYSEEQRIVCISHTEARDGSEIIPSPSQAAVHVLAILIVDPDQGFQLVAIIRTQIQENDASSPHPDTAVRNVSLHFDVRNRLMRNACPEKAAFLDIHIQFKSAGAESLVFHILEGKSPLAHIYDLTDSAEMIPDEGIPGARESEAQMSSAFRHTATVPEAPPLRTGSPLFRDNAARPAPPVWRAKRPSLRPASSVLDLLQVRPRM
jgi:hypothetical protein